MRASFLKFNHLFTLKTLAYKGNLGAEKASNYRSWPDFHSRQSF